MSSQGLHLLDAISWILSSKNECFVTLTALLNAFQSLTCLVILYFISLDWQVSFHHTLECLVMLTYFECLYQMTSELLVNSWTAHKVLHVNSLNGNNKFIDEIVFFFTILDNCMLFCWNMFFKDRDVNCQWSVIR